MTFGLCLDLIFRIAAKNGKSVPGPQTSVLNYHNDAMFGSSTLSITANVTVGKNNRGIGIPTRPEPLEC